MTTPASFLTEEMRKQAIGQKSEPRSIDIEKGAIIKFAQFVGCTANAGRWTPGKLTLDELRILVDMIVRYEAI